MGGSLIPEVLGSGSATLKTRDRLNAIPIREIHIEKQCSDILEVDGWRPLKTDPVSDRSRGKGFGELGMADRLYIRYEVLGPSTLNEIRTLAEVMWIEWKRPKGIVKPHQAAWHLKERKRGGFTVIAGQDFQPTFEAFCEWYRNSGLLRRKGLV